MSVCSLLRYRLNVFLPQLPEVRCPIFFWDSEFLGKSTGKKWSQIWTFLDVCEFLRFGWFFPFFKPIWFFGFLVNPETTLPDGLETSGWRAYRYFWHISRCFWVFAFKMIFSVKKKISFFGILGSPYCDIGATIRISREMLCLPYAGFFSFLTFISKKKRENILISKYKINKAFWLYLKRHWIFISCSEHILHQAYIAMTMFFVVHFVNNLRHTPTLRKIMTF